VKDAEAPAQLCNRAMFELLYSSGLRISELVGLDERYRHEANYSSLGWIDFDSAEVTVTGKGNKMRSVPVGAPAMQALKQWLTARTGMIARIAGADHSALFLSERGTRMTPRVAQLRLKAHGQALGLATDVHPHMLRHSFASHVLQGSGDCVRYRKCSATHQSLPPRSTLRSISSGWPKSTMRHTRAPKKSSPGSPLSRAGQIGA